MTTPSGIPKFDWSLLFWVWLVISCVIGWIVYAHKQAELHKPTPEQQEIIWRMEGCEEGIEKNQALCDSLRRY